MRTRFAFIFLMLAIACGAGAFLAFRSRKSIGRSVGFLLVSLIFPIIGNMIITIATEQNLAELGCYIYYVGMDFVMFAVLEFTFAYCRIQWPSQKLRKAVIAVLLIDILQIVLNPILGLTFHTEQILVDGLPYFRLVPHIGQTFHRIVDYGIYAAVVLIFLNKLIHTPRIYSERYSVILAAMIFTGIAETFFVFSTTPIDQSMIGFGIFGLLVFYFSLYYRPLRLLDQMLAGIASELPEAMFFFDAVGRCIWVNRPALLLTGAEEENFEKAEIRLKEMFGLDPDPEKEWKERRELGTGENTRYYVLEKRNLRDDNGVRTAAFVSVRDNTEDEKRLLRETYAASHDILTGIYTREYLYRMIREKLNEPHDQPYLAIYADVKDFKIINDIFGREFGDYALKHIADWIRANVTGHAIYGRLSGDTFGICLPKDEFHPIQMQQRLSALRISDDKVSHHVQIHLGVYEISEPELEVSVMFDRAHLALLTIKNEYQRHIAWYDNAMRDRVLWNQHISNQLPDAIKNGEIVPYLQPIVDRSGIPVGAEVLVRWNHPTDGFLSPASFIPVFEDNGMIALVDRYMWRCACRILAKWKKTNPDLFLSVNISPKDFYFMDVAEEIIVLCREFQISPRSLRIEITETVMMSEMTKRMEILRRLRNEGFIVEIDDFGSGYSSLNMLKDMPADVLKIDMFFLSRTRNSEKAELILSNVMHMSKDLGIATLSEGVETKEQYVRLKEMGCQLFQGYYFSRPIPQADFELYLKRFRKA